MLLDLIKNLSIYICTTMTSVKILNDTTLKNHSKSIILILSFISTTLTCTIKQFLPEMAHFLTLIIICLVIALLTQRPKETLISIIIGFGLSYTSFSISVFIMTCLVFSILPETSNNAYSYIVLFSAILHLLFIIKICNTKRFRRGIPHLLSTGFINKASFICLILLFFLSYIQLGHFKHQTLIIILFALIFSLAFLIHWWQAQITKSYKQSLIMRELDSLRIEVEEKDKELKLLKQQNEELGRLIHHDNKRIPAMEHAVCEYLVSDFSNIDDMKNKANSLRLEIESLSRNRSNTLKEIYAQKSNHYTTGINALDTLLNYMANRATTDKIEFNVHNTLNLNDYVPTQISAEDFTHLLSDLLENAIIATNLADSKIIQLQFYVSEKHFVIEVADSGIPFETKSIVNLGLSQLTTHESTGGSGIGLMDIWKIKEIYGATLHIEEYKMPSPFTKKISLIFNHKNMYSIRTFRSEEITAITKRNDLKIYDDSI